MRRSPRWMIRSVELASIPVGPVMYTDGMSNDESSPRVSS